MRHELLRREPDITGDAAQQNWRQVPAAMHRHGRYATVFMTKSFVRSSLASFLESKRGENGDDLARL